jgi:hypothetical protein
MTTTDDRRVSATQMNLNRIDYPSALGAISKALFVFNMNWMKPQIKRSTKEQMLRDLRDACANFVRWCDD